MNPDEVTRSLAADPRNAGDPTAWFDQLYVAAGKGTAEVPWDRGQPNVLLAEWVNREQPHATSRTIVVGAGYGRDSEYLAGLGFRTTASRPRVTTGRRPPLTPSTPRPGRCCARRWSPSSVTVSSWWPSSGS